MAKKIRQRRKTDSPDLQKILDEVYRTDIDRLQCLVPMVLYYQCVNRTIKKLIGDKHSNSENNVVFKMSAGQIREFRRYINSDLDNLSIEFYLQRANWARKCGAEKDDPRHREQADKNPAKHPCRMKKNHGFYSIVEGGEYSYEEFLGETLPIFIAIHNHLVSINAELGNLYSYVTEAPFAGFTPTGKTEILHMTRGLERLMRALLVATHLQPQHPWQEDVANYLVSCRADCQRFFETIPKYYQTHRLRLVLFPIDPPHSEEDQRGSPPHIMPLTCLPWSAGAYLDFLSAYENIAKHITAVLAWSLRLYSLWFFVPRRYLRLISPTFRT